VINWEITVGNIVTITAIVLGGLWTLFSIQGKVEGVGADVKRLGKRADLIETSMEDVRKAMIQLAVQDERMNNQDARMNRLAEELRDLKHGQGFVLDLPAPRSPG
jgi:hypothetical protein